MVVETRQDGMMSEGIAKIKMSIIESPVVHDTERIKFLIDVYRETDGEPPIMRRAKLFDRVMSCKTIYIDENPIVGTMGRGRNYVYGFPEYSAWWMRMAMVERLEQGEISRRQAARHLAIGYATLKRLLDARLYQTNGIEQAILVPATPCNNGIVYDGILVTY